MPPRKNISDSSEPPKKKGSGSLYLHELFKKGEVISDTKGNRWKIGRNVGIGGFGVIYDVSEYRTCKELKSSSQYVAKIEKHTNGPLFVEINCYLRIAKQEMIEKWKKENNLRFLGVPHFVASGSHFHNGDKYRFLIIPKYDKDLEAILNKKMVFNLKTVLVIASRIIDTLEYIHSHGYVHADIKASNIMLGKNNNVDNTMKLKTVVKDSSSGILKKTRLKRRTCGRNLRSISKQNYIDDIPYLEDVLNEYENEKNNSIIKHTKSEAKCSSNGAEESKANTSSFEGDEIYLLDYGLASRYMLTNGEYREFTSDQRRAHAGTLIFCSRDAHKGILSTRSDLESLAYNMVYWLTGSLPWSDDLDFPEIVEKKKNTFFTDVKMFLKICFRDCPRFLVEMFCYLSELQLMDTPNYDFFRILFRKTIKEYGYKNDLKPDFDNLEGCGKKKKNGKEKLNKKENESVFKRPSLLLYSPRKPLSSNIIFKRPKLRKKVNDKLAKNSMMNWSKILIMDPETIIKQGHRKNTDNDNCINILEMDLESLNPTPAMREVFNRASERGENSPYGTRADGLCIVDSIDGYTPEMMRVHKIMIEQREFELEKAAQSNIVSKKRGRKRIKRSELSVRTSSRNLRHEVNYPSPHSLRKTKSNPLKRTYSLRG